MKLRTVELCVLLSLCTVAPRLTISDGGKISLFLCFFCLIQGLLSVLCVATYRCTEKKRVRLHDFAADAGRLRADALGVPHSGQRLVEQVLVVGAHAFDEKREGWQGKINNAKCLE